MVRPGAPKAETFAVGGVTGLNIQVLPSGAASWLLRVLVGEKRREIGLGGYPDVTLAQAREKAREAREAIRQGIDPVEKRKAARAALVAAQRRGLTFSTAVDRFLAAKGESFKNSKHRAQWGSTLAVYAIPELAAMMVHDITTQVVLPVLEPIWTEKTETAARPLSPVRDQHPWNSLA